MNHIPWKEWYCIHYKEIDEQHQGLLAILNELVEMNQIGADRDQVTGIYQRLCQYAIHHFATEEKYLKASGYEGLAQQRAEHASFIDRILELDRAHDPSDPALLVATTAFLKNWFVDHIMASDQDYGDWVKAFHRKAKIQGVIFDLGTVLGDFEHHLMLGKLSAICKVPPRELGRLIYKPSLLSREFDSGLVSPEQFLEAASRLCGHAFSEAEFVPIYCDLFTPIQFTWKLLKRLKGRYRLGLIGNTNPWHFEHGIRTSEVFPLFNAVTLSYQRNALKPDPRLFQDNLDKLDLVAEECVFIDATAACAEAADECLLHGIHYRGPLHLMRELRGRGITI